MKVRPGVAAVTTVLAVALVGMAAVSQAPASSDSTRGPISWLVGRGGPIRFQTSACLAYAAKGRWNGRTVFLDPGHGGLDPGAAVTISGRAVAEKNVALAVGLRTLALLRQAGFRVVMSRVRDSTVARLGRADRNGNLLTAAGVHRELAARNLCANAARASVLVGIHMDAFGDRSAAGAETIYCRDRLFAERSRQLAALIQHTVLTSFRRAGWTVPDRGIRDDHGTGAPALSAQGAAYGHWLELGPARLPWFRYPSQMPAVIVEPLFLSNPAEAGIARSRAGQLALARGLAQALDTHFHQGRSG